MYSAGGNKDNTNNNNHDSYYALYLILCHRPNTLLSAFHRISSFRPTTVLRDITGLPLLQRGQLRL